jgi:predicted Zn-dependent protease
VEQNPQDPISYNQLAAAQLYKELYRLGMLESSALRGDNEFLRQQKPAPDPKVKAQFESTLEKARRVAESQLARDRRDQTALYALGTSYALWANYEFMIEKAWFSSLRKGGKARDYCEQLRKVNPEFVDAYLVLGVHEYVVGSLPLPVKVLAAIGGLRGSKKKGEAWVTRVSREGNYARNDARVLLVVLYRRERRPIEAARLLEELIAEFPRNYVLGLELASMYTDAGQKGRALATFRELLKKAEENAPGYQRLPREAVRRKIERLENGQ